jgi:hypothetical protein
LYPIGISKFDAVPMWSESDRDLFADFDPEWLDAETATQAMRTRLPF